MRDDPTVPVLSVRLAEVEPDAHALLAVQLDVSGIARIAGGLPLRPDAEEFTISCSAAFPFVPPRVLVSHDRFRGHANVLQGQQLCVFLDPSREWHPSGGPRGFMQQMWRWLEDAAAGRHDPARALFHPVGGVQHFGPDAGVLVVREPVGWEQSARPVLPFERRSAHRIDVHRTCTAPTGHLRAVRLSRPLHTGAGTTLRGLMAAVAALGVDELSALLTAVAATMKRASCGSEALVLLGVPHAATSAPEDVHLLGARLGDETVAWLRAFDSSGSPPHAGPDEPLEWLNVSDERTVVATRRDHARPVHSLHGANIELWGCGGIGSWAAEYCARAGAARIVLCDSGRVGRGLLVRQNYTELDVGEPKVEALTRRLGQINDDINSEPIHGDVIARMSGHSLRDCDVLIDATVNLSVASFAQQIWQRSTVRPLLGRMMLDSATATLGMLQLSRPGSGPGPEELDARTGERVRADPRLEAYETFWRETTEEVLPERGCSVPTFHGSAADASAVAASLVSLLAGHIKSSSHGTHLIALPHTSTTAPGHVWMAADQDFEPLAAGL